MSLLNLSPVRSEVIKVDFELEAFASLLLVNSDTSHMSYFSKILKMGLLTVKTLFGCCVPKGNYKTCLKCIVSPHFLEKFPT